MLPAIPISLALVGLDPPGIGLPAPVAAATDHGPLVRSMLEWARRQGVRAVQLNAATPGVRPRDLDRSARRDLAATLRRLDLACTGLDLWIPPEHFADPLHADRAVASVLGALDLAHDLAALAGGSVVSSRPVRPGVVSLALPPSVPTDVLDAMTVRAQARAAVIADHAWPVRPEAAASTPGLAAGIDAATLLGAGADPAAELARLGSRTASVRLTDLARGLGAGRVPIGSRSGRLDVLAFSVALATSGSPAAAVLDLRGLPNQADALRTSLQALGAETAPAAAP